MIKSFQIFKRLHERSQQLEKEEKDRYKINMIVFFENIFYKEVIKEENKKIQKKWESHTQNIFWKNEKYVEFEPSIILKKIEIIDVCLYYRNNFL